MGKIGLARGGTVTCFLIMSFLSSHLFLINRFWAFIPPCAGRHGMSSARTMPSRPGDGGHGRKAAGGSVRFAPFHRHYRQSRRSNVPDAKIE